VIYQYHPEHSDAFGFGSFRLAAEIVMDIILIPLLRCVMNDIYIELGKAQELVIIMADFGIF
jgi:hypothetical protein